MRSNRVTSLEVSSKSTPLKQTTQRSAFNMARRRSKDSIGSSGHWGQGPGKVKIALNKKICGRMNFRQYLFRQNVCGHCPLNFRHI